MSSVAEMSAYDELVGRQAELGTRWRTNEFVDVETIG